MSAWKVQSTSANEILHKDAIDILRKLETASNNKQRRRYNKILKDLRAQYPDKASMIDSHFISATHGRRKKSPKLSSYEKDWIRTWKEIQGR
jgi:hypothetical protein